MCPHNMLDPLGHHVNLVGLWHIQLRDTFVQTCHFAGVSASIEAGSGQRHEHLHTRPAGFLLPNWVCSKLEAPRLYYGLITYNVVQPILVKWVPQLDQLPSQQKETCQPRAQLGMCPNGCGGIWSMG